MKATFGDSRLPERFWDKVVERDCWVWVAALDIGGYGKFSTSTSRWSKAHRVVYEALVGPISEGLVVDHLCRNRACVNPAHLEPVTSAENTRRGKAVITHCPADHPLSGDNVITWRGHRKCRTCNNDRRRLRRGGTRVAAVDLREVAA